MQQLEELGAPPETLQQVKSVLDGVARMKVNVSKLAPIIESDGSVGYASRVANLAQPVAENEQLVAQVKDKWDAVLTRKPKALYIQCSESGPL